MTEYIRISEFQRRAFGDNGTPWAAWTIRKKIMNGDLPGKQIGKLYFVDWPAYCAMTGDALVDRVLRLAS